uniref:excinuclease ABC subunit UvrA n=1 Tax=uncultured Actinomyces sp. TaxID=249061 RepID=UPI0028057CF1
MNDSLIIRGAREHNLKGVDLDLPRDTMIVFTGLSGSGKSSLAFDTIFAEGQRRYVESLSSYARQFLGQMDKPDVELIEGLSPAVSIDQKSTSRNPRSTVGTVTEIYDYLRLLYARAGIQHCPVCDAVISSQTPQQIVDQVRSLPEGTRFQVLAPVVRGRKGEYSELFGELRGRGFNRVRVDGAAERLDNPPTLNKRLKHDIEVIVDRLVVREGIRQRLTDSVETALGLAEGLVIIEQVDLPEDDPDRERRYSEKRACPNEHPLALDEMEPRTFSFNAPYGACPACTGIGTRLEVDPELVVPDEELTLAEGAVAPWSSHQKYFTRQLEALGKELSFDVDTPWRALPARAREAILRGKDYEVKVTYRNRWGRERIYSTGFEGVLDYVMRKHDETESDWSRERYQAYMREIPCPVCDGARLKPEVLAVRVGELSIAQLCELPINEARDFLADLNLTGQAAQIAGSVLTEINARLGFLVDVGLDYLSLARGAATLSGGDAQRIRLATQIGSGLVGVLYVLDEPSIGLHQRDNTRLIETLQRLRDLGNTLIVVEHDEDTIRSADWIVDIGPGAGELGGEVVYSGDVAGLVGAEGSVTGDYLARRRQIEIPSTRRKRDKNREVTVVGARENNLKDVTVSFPLGVLTAVTGVSGSGKSSLVNSILYQVLANRLNRARGVPGRHKTVRGVEHLDKVVHVDQSPIGRTPRS